MTEAQILIVEDDFITQGLMETRLAAEGFETTVASDGKEAWDILKSGPAEFDTILLDRMMPRMDGLTLLRKLHEGPDPFRVPVVMVTGLGERAHVVEGLQAGAYYYLAKPLQPEVLVAIVKAAVSQYRDGLALRRAVHQREQAQCFLTTAAFHYRTLEEGAALAAILADLCPDPERAVLGLMELLFNAVEHGNLGLTYADKARLLTDDGWIKEIARRQALPENQAKTVEVGFERSSGRLIFTVKDSGDGFDWARFLDFDPERLFDPNGRGIAIARHQSFDSLEYLGNGNTVKATVTVPDKPG